MARRRDKSPLMDLMLSQWWVGLVIAIVIYLIGSNATSIVSFDSQLMGVFNVLLSLAEDFAFVISVPFVLISIVAWFKAKHRSKLLERQNDIESIRDLSWQDFEVLVGEACRRQGYTVEETGGGGADGGIDLRLRKNGNLAIVQCKRWKTQRVGVSPIRELFGLMIAEQAQSAIFVCSGSYTKDALQFADQNGISLVDGDALYGLVEDVQETPIPAPVPVAPLEINEPVAEATEQPSCPACGGEMILRVAKRGKNTGREFWGCLDFPKCRGSIS